MQTDEIFIPLFAKKITDPPKIFTSIKTFDELLFWCRECTRERLQKHTTQRDLARKIDDIGSEVDNYLRKVRLKMLKNGQNGKNSLFKRLCSTESTIKWLVERWGNVFLNLATNPKYKAFIDVRNVGYQMHENTGHHEDALSILILEEQQKEFEQKRKNEVKKWQQEWAEMLENGRIGGEINECGNTQLILIF
jgi:hypothetical protein